MKKQIKVAYFPSTATKDLVLSSNGKSLDKYCIKCETTEDLSTGNYILDATFLIEDNLQDLLQEEVILKVLMDYGSEIFRISKPTVGTRYIDIVARQITIADALTLWLEDVRPTSMSGANTTDYLVSNAIGVKEIQVVSNISNISTAYYPKMSLYKALYDCDQSFLNIWGGEILRRGYINYINSEIGISRGFTIREGKNLTGFECTSNIDNLVTRAQGKGFDGIVGNYIDSPLIGAYNRVYTDVIEYPDVKVKDENTEGYDTLAEAQAELDRRVQEEYSKNGIDKIKASYDINFVQLEKTEEYKNYIIAERVYLGDAIRVYVPKINTDIQVRAMSKKYDILAQKTKGITLSNYIEPKSLSIKQIIERLESMDSTENILQYAIDNASLLIKAGIKNSYVVVRENEIVIGDTKDINTMTKVWRFNNGGLGFSSTGYYGSFDTAITMDGSIVGKFITANSISASQIKTDELVVGTNIAMGVNAIITWANLNEESKINLKGETGIQGIPGLDGSDATVPSYITSTKITATTIESPTLNGGTINGGTINGAVINQTVDSTVVGSFYSDSTGGNLDIKNVSGTNIVSLDSAYGVSLSYSTGALAGYFADTGIMTYGFGDIGTSLSVGTNISVGGDIGVGRIVGKGTNYYRINIGLGDTRMDVTGGTFRLYNSAIGSSDTGIAFDGTSLYYKVDSVTKFLVYGSNGTKTGGFIEIDGMNVGLSPVDSPRYLHQDIMYDVQVEETGTVLFLDELFAKTLKGYAVFPNNGKVEISEKTTSSFKVTGFTGIVDFNIIGNRKDMTEQYFDII